MAGVKQPRRQTGPAFKLQMTINSSKTPQSSPPKSLCLLCLFVAILFLLSCPLRLYILTKNDQIYSPAKSSQDLLYSRLVDSGCVTMPSSKQHRSTKAFGSFLGLAHLTVILLLAVDVETNPSPVPKPCPAQPWQLATTQEQPTWTLPLMAGFSQQPPQQPALTPLLLAVSLQLLSRQLTWPPSLSPSPSWRLPRQLAWAPLLLTCGKAVGRHQRQDILHNTAFRDDNPEAAVTTAASLAGRRLQPTAQQLDASHNTALRDDNPEAAVTTTDTETPN